MIITFLGTGTSGGVPMIGCHCPVCSSTNSRDQRLRSSIWVQTQDRSLLIDAGPDFRQQALANHIESLDAVLLTHFHKDHLAGLDDLKPFCYLRPQSEVLPLFANEATAKVIKNEFAFAFQTPQMGLAVPQFDLQVIDEQPFDFQDITIQPIPIIHHHLPIFGFRIGNMAYITDAKHIPETSYPLLKDLDVLIINALSIKSHPAHFSLNEALNEIKRIAPRRAFLTHIGHRLGFAEEVAPTLPTNVALSYDGLVIESE